MILLELYVDEYYIKEKLMGVITMTSTYIEQRENKLKQEIKIEKQRADNAEKILKELPMIKIVLN